VAKLPTSFNVGDRDNLTPEKLLEMLEDMYQEISTHVNLKPNARCRMEGDTPTLGSPDDTFVTNGDLNIKVDTGTVEMATIDPDTGDVTWNEIQFV